jgi:hypothetical protein
MMTARNFSGLKNLFFGLFVAFVVIGPAFFTTKNTKPAKLSTGRKND